MSAAEPRLEFDVAVDDLVDFTVSRFLRSPQHQRVQRISRVAVSIGLCAIVVGFGLWLDAPYAAAFGLPFGVFYYFRYPRQSERLARRHVRRVYQKAGADAGVGRQSLQMEGQVLDHTIGKETARVPLWAIQNIERTPTAVYLVLDANSAVVIPTGSVNSVELGEFMTELERRRPKSE